MFNSYVTNYQGVETYQSTRRPSTRSRWARHLWTQALETFGNGTRKCCQLPNPPSISHIFTSFPGPASSFPHAEFASRQNQGQSPPPKCPWWPLLEPRSSVTSHLENTMTLYTYIILYIYTYVYIISYYSASYPPSPANARGSAPGNKTFGCLAALGSSMYTMQHQHSTAAGRPCLTQFFYGFRRHGRHVRQFLGYILSLFRPSLPLRFPVREGCLCSISSTRQQHQQQPSTSAPWSISTAQQQEGDVWHSSSTVLDDTLDTFWARFWRCSVLQSHCVSLSGRVRFQLREGIYRNLC